ncbi:MAG: 1-deoxy-D-xylulose-5-phosphate synthase, partial [Flavobacteriaceae bacterium]|nr:1-deoxy-D-xylulose-5-phosphate synthase [Flavobacteriaceae bacterium]
WITVEDGSAKGGFGSAISEFLHENNFSNSLKLFGVPDSFVPHGTIAEVRAFAGIDILSITQYIQKLISK